MQVVPSPHNADFRHPDFIGGVGLYLAAILEWVLGNTFPSTVFALFGGYWLAFAFLLQPSQGIAAAVGATSLDYNAGVALYLVWWGVLTLSAFPWPHLAFIADD